MSFSPKTKRVIIIVCMSVLMLCMIWSFTRGESSERSRICKFLAEHGYEVHEDELLFAYDNSKTSIRAAIDQSDEELSKAVNASKEGGFNSDVDKEGSVTLILAKADDDEVVYLYMLDGDFELCFVQHGEGIEPLD